MRRIASVGESDGSMSNAASDCALLLLDRADHLDQQPFLRPEVVDEHAVAGADRGGEAAQAEVADAVRRDVVDRRLQQSLLRVVLAARH